MATLKELTDEQARIKAELQRMEDDETVTDEDGGDLRDTLIARWEELDGKSKPLIERMEKIKGITRAAENPGNLEGPDGGGGFDGRGTPDLVIRTRRDPYDANEAIRAKVVRHSEVISRAHDAIEMEAKRGILPHDFAEEATRKVTGSYINNDVAKHILLTGSEEYQEAFRAYITNPQGEAQRAALALSPGSAGGFLLPFVLDPSIVLTNASSANPWRRISNVKTTTSNTWNGVNSAGVNAAWLSEGTMVTDGSPTLGNIVVTPAKAAAWVFGQLTRAA